MTYALPDEQTIKQAREAVRYLNGLSGVDLSGFASVQLVVDSNVQEPIKVDLPRKRFGSLLTCWLSWPKAMR